MRILFLNDYATPNGGAEIQLHGLREQLRRRGHDARLLSSTAGRTAGDGLAEYDCFGTLSSGRTLLQTANWSAARAVDQAIAAFAPDIVHVTMFLTQLSPLVLRSLRGIPCVYQVVWNRPICPNGTKLLPEGSPCGDHWGFACYRHGCLPMRDWLPLMLQMSLLERWRRSVSLYIANSHAMQAALTAHGYDPITTLWNGTPEVPARAPLPETPSVAFVGRLVREKGADLAVRVFARVLESVPSAQFVIVGDGPERPAIERLVASLGIGRSVRMLGHLPRAEADAAVAGCWLQVAPSQWVEPFGLVAIEAQMRGTAVLASKSGGFLDSIDDGGTGLLLPPRDETAWARAISELLIDRQRAEQMGRAGRDRARRLFSESAIVDQLLGIYARVIDDAGRRA